MAELLTEEQLAERWQLSVRTLQNLRSLRKGAPFVKIGRTVRYRAEDIAAYEAANVRGEIAA